MLPPPRLKSHTAELMDNTFILKLQRNRFHESRRERLAAALIKFVNPRTRLLKLKFKDDDLNRHYGIKNSPVYDSKENMLRHLMTSVEQTINIYHLLTQVVLLDVPGDVVELGCFEGSTAIIMQKTLDQLESEKRLHVYDSFEGLPAKRPEDGSTDFAEGDCQVQMGHLVELFESHETRLPEIHSGWFSKTLPDQLPEKIAFAHLDGDFYSSIMESLEYVYPRLSPGAIVVIDDYCDPAIHAVNNILPGVKKACDEFLKGRETVNVLIAGCEAHGYFRKSQDTPPT